MNDSTVKTASGIPVHCACAGLADVADLRPHPKNPNRHPDEQIALLAKNIRALGWRHPVIVSRLSGCIVAGHARVEAARLLQVAQVPVDYQAFAGETEETAYLIADNRLAELAERDNEAIRGLLAELGGGEMDVDLTGYAAKAVESLTDQYRVEEITPPELKDGDRAPFRQATFTLHDEQWAEVEAALAKAKKDGGGESAVNENSNGNALAWICGRFNRG